MKPILIIAAILIAASAAPQRPSAQLLSKSEVRDDFGQYTLQFQTTDGTIFVEQGILKPTSDGKDYVLVKEGRYSYTSPEGTPVRLSYTADESGFLAESPNIPRQPVIQLV